MPTMKCWYGTWACIFVLLILFPYGQVCRVFLPLPVLSALILFGMRHKFFLPPVSLCGFILEVALTIVSVLCSTAGQVAFKVAAQRDFFRAMPYWSCGVSFMLASVLVVTMVLRTAPLSAMMSFAALAYVTTPLAALLVFKESVNKRFWLGTLFIIAGAMLTLA